MISALKIDSTAWIFAQSHIGMFFYSITMFIEK